MNKKILTSAIVLSGLLFGGNVFASDYINIDIFLMMKKRIMLVLINY